MITHKDITKRAAENFDNNRNLWELISELQLKIERLESEKQGESDEEAFEKWRKEFKTTGKSRYQLLKECWLASRKRK